MWKLFISTVWLDPVLTDSLHTGNPDTSQCKTEIRFSPRTSYLPQPAILQTVASVLLKYLGKESIEGEMKALPPTALPHEPCSPAEQSWPLVFIITPRLSHFMPLSPLSVSAENLSVALYPRQSHLPRTNYNANSSECLLTSWEGCLPLVNTQKTLSTSLFLRFSLSPIKVHGMIMESVEEGRRKEKRKREKTNPGRYAQ